MSMVFDIDEETATLVSVMAEAEGVPIEQISREALVE